MQTIEKALHAPMPFTTGGQTISDRLTAAKHSLAGSQLGKTICKATTEEVMAPKKKHLDYLLHCTNEPNVSVPSMANLLIERTQNPNWTVVYKALITIHNIMCYGNERFSQYLASCNTTFNLTAFVDKNSAAGGYDMSTHVRRYAKYISEKINTYRMCAFDFCKVKRGREDGLLRTMHTDKLLKTIPILQNQIDALLEFQVTSSELVNGVINCSFILLFRDLIRLFACYNDGIINVLEKYFDMQKKQCRDALDTYKSFLTRLDKVAEFLRVAESVGIDRGEIPDLTRAPASLLEALEAHLYQLENGKPQPSSHTQQVTQQQLASFTFSQQPNIADAERQRYLDLENAKLSQFREEQEQKKSSVSANPFAADAASGAIAPATADLLDWNQATTTAPMTTMSQQPVVADTNPFAVPFPQQPTYQNASAIASNTAYGGQPFFPSMHQTTNEIAENPFAMASAQMSHQTPAPPVPPPPSVAAIAAAHPAAAPINPFADMGAASQTPFGQAPLNDQGYAQFNPNQADDLARMTQQMSLNQQGHAWNQSAGSSNPFNGAQQVYQGAMGGYPPQFAQPQMWQLPAYGHQYQYPGGQINLQQQKQVQLVHQMAASQQQQQAQAAVNDPFGA